MKKTGMWIGLGVVLVVGLWVMGSFNGLVHRQQTVDLQWSQVESSYQRRFDLIPSLVNSVKGHLAQEQTVFGDIAKARTQYAGSAGSSRVDAANQLESALARLLVIIENYPQLRSAETVQGLMAELAGTENRINVARERYNEAVRSYAVATRAFPGRVFASVFGFESKAYFASQESAHTAPAVDLTVSRTPS